MNRIKFITLAAGSSLAMAFTISCSNENELLTDSRDGKVYRTVKIGKQTWMAENLNYSDADSIGRCYDDEPSNCEKYGKLYDWDAAMKACPKGWHLPSYGEWDTLYEHIGAGKMLYFDIDKKLKTKSGWTKETREDDEDRTLKLNNGTDDYGFTALPAGIRFCVPIYDKIIDDKMVGCLDDKFEALGQKCSWWTATEKGNNKARYWSIEWSRTDLFHKMVLMSVRCIKD